MCAREAMCFRLIACLYTFVVQYWLVCGPKCLGLNKALTNVVQLYHRGSQPRRPALLFCFQCHIIQT